jgi:hypothetical protein
MILNRFVIFIFILLTGCITRAEFNWSVPLRTELYQPTKSSIENDLSFVLIPKLELTYKTIEFKFENLLRHSINQSSRDYVLLQDNFARVLVTDEWSVLFGTKIYNWGSLEAFSPMDFINSRNYNATFFSDEKLGEPVIEISGLTAYGSFEFIFQPALIDPLYPAANSPFGFDFDLQAPRWNSSSEDSQPAQFNTAFPQFSLKWEKSLSGLDLLAFYSRHFEKNHFYIGTTDFLTLPTNPPITQALSSPNVIQMIDMHKLGLGLVRSYESWLFKSEVVHNEPVGNLEIYNPVTGLSTITSHTLWNLGLQWSPTIYNNLNTMFFLEWQKVFGYESKEQRQLYEIFQNDLAFIFKISNSAIYAQSLDLAFIFDLEIQGQYIMSINYEKRLSESTNIQARAQWIETPNSNDVTNFDLLENRSHYFIALEYYF